MEEAEVASDKHADAPGWLVWCVFFLSIASILLAMLAIASHGKRWGHEAGMSIFISLWCTSGGMAIFGVVGALATSKFRWLGLIPVAAFLAVLPLVIAFSRMWQ